MMIASLISLLFILHWVQAEPFLAVNTSSTARSRTREAPCLGVGQLSCMTVDIDFDAVWNKEVIEFLNGVRLQKTLDIPVASDPNVEAGQFQNGDNSYYAVLTYSTKTSGNKRMTGILNTLTQSFLIENCGEGCHVLIEQDTSRFNDDAVVPGNVNMFMSAAKLAIQDGPIVYSIQFYFTPGFAAITPDIAGFVNTIIVETNAGYANSEVSLRAEIRCIEQSTSHTSDVISGTNLASFSNEKGSQSATLNTADVAMLLTADIDGANYCGIGYLPGRFSLVAKSCATGYFSAGHEIGHNFGCHHDRSAAGVGKTGNGYNYGYHIGKPIRTERRTIMAYYTNGWTYRVNQYSSDTVLYNTYATGDANNDNSRVLMENAATIASFGDESSICTAFPTTTFPPPPTTAPPPPPTTAPPPPVTTAPPPPPPTTAAPPPVTTAPPPPPPTTAAPPPPTTAPCTDTESAKYCRRIVRTNRCPNPYCRASCQEC